MSALEQVKRNIRENDIKYFTDEEINSYLKENNNDVNLTSYYLLIIKSEDTSVNISGLTTQSTSKYFLRLASKYRPTNSGILS